MTDMTRISNFLTTVVIHFPPKFDSPGHEAEWLRSIATALQGFSATTLQRAAQRIINTRKYRSFPLVSEIVTVCDEIGHEDNLKNPKFNHPAHDPANKSWTAWTEERKQWANQLIQSEIGRQAAREDWILALHDFIRINNRLPAHQYEIDKLKRVSRGVDDDYRELADRAGQEAMLPAPHARSRRRSTFVQVGAGLPASLMRFADSMFARRKKLAAIANGA